MSDQIDNQCERWLGETWPAGALHVGGCDSQGKLFSRSLVESGPTHISNEAWSTLNEAVAQLDAHGCGNGRSIWVFEQAMLWVARRPDGAWAGIFAASTLSDVTRSALEARLEEFGGKRAPKAE